MFGIKKRREQRAAERAFWAKATAELRQIRREIAAVPREVGDAVNGAARAGRNGRAPR